MNDNIYSATCDDYVDIYGRDLKVVVSDDGIIYIPLTEVRKTGFHIFPKSKFNSSWVTKTMVQKEFQLFMLGVAREFLKQNDIRSLKHDDILQTIEMCLDQVMNSSDETPMRNGVSSGILGRTLLTNPAEISKEVRSTLHKTLTQSSENVNPRSNTRRDSVDSLRLPHQTNDTPKYENSSNQESNLNKLRNRSNNFLKNKLTVKNEVNKPNNYNNQLNKRNFQNNYQANSNVVPKKPGSIPDESKSNADAEDVEFIRLSDATLERIQLQKHFQQVKIVHIDKSNDKQKYWVQLASNEDIVVDILSKIIDIPDNMRIKSPKVNEIYAAQSTEDQMWYRAIVLRVNPVIKVHFIDFGNDDVVTELKELPKDLKNIPAQAVRITLPKIEGSTQQHHFTEEETLNVKFLKQFSDTTILVTNENRPRPKAQVQTENKKDPFEVVILKDKVNYSCVLLDKEMVKIQAHNEGKFYLRNKEHHEKLRSIQAHIKELPESPLSKIEIGQVVLCRKEDEEVLCRSVIRKIDDGIVTVEFIDFHTEETVSLKGLFGISKTIANMPVSLIESPQLIGYSAAKMTEESQSIIEEMILNKVKLYVSLKNNEFDLTINDKSFSEMIFPRNIKLETEDLKLRPSEVKTKVVEEKQEVASKNVPLKKENPSSQYVKIMYENMPSFEAPLGKRDYMLTNYSNPTDFTVTPTSDAETDMLTKCTFIDVKDEEPYDPVDNEIVLAFYDEGWYRGAVLDTLDDGKYQILFIEYGNTATLTRNKIRKVPQYLREIPMIGLTCQMAGVPDNETVKKRLMELLVSDNIYEIDFVSYDIEDQVYLVEIPSVKDVLQKEGLL